MKFILLVSLFILLPFYLFAQDEIHKTNSEEENHFHYNHFAVFAGASSLFEKNETHFTLGADYIRYFSPESNFAAGVFAEAIFAHHTEWLFGALLYYGLTEHLWIRTGPGIEILQEDLECGCGTKTKTEFLVRLGAVYDFHLGKFSISPSLDIDFLRNSTTLVWGVNFGMGF
jgi:hypothetical protein